MSNDIKAIETEYDGHRFRSRLEARWAVFFNAVGLTYEYEIEGFEMDGTRYIPDFYIPSLNRWFEIKGKPLSLNEIKKCEEFCRRLDNENIKYSVLIGSPNLCAVRVGDFFGILEYVWEWPSEKYPDNYRIQALKELIPYLQLEIQDLKTNAERWRKECSNKNGEIADLNVKISEQSDKIGYLQKLYNWVYDIAKYACQKLKIDVENAIKRKSEGHRTTYIFGDEKKRSR